MNGDLNEDCMSDSQFKIGNLESHEFPVCGGPIMEEWGVTAYEIPADHQIPECELCQEETYNLACERCKLRICNACSSRGHYCACYDEFGNYIGYDSDEDSWYTHMSDYTDSENEHCFAFANREGYAT